MKKIKVISIPGYLILIFYLLYPFQNIYIGVTQLKLYYLIFIFTSISSIIIFLYKKFHHSALDLLLIYTPFLIWIWISNFFSVDLNYSIYMSLKYLMYYFITITISILLINIQNLWKGVLWIIIISSIIISFIYIYKFIIFGLPILYGNASMNSIGEIASINVGFGGGRNLMASWLSFTFTFPLFYFLLENKNFKIKTILIIISLLLFTVIILSLSRTSILSIFVFIFLYYFISNERRVKVNIRRFFYIIFMTVFIILFFNPVNIGDFLSTRFLLAINSFINNENMDYGVSGRKELWEYAWKSIQEHPFLGTGIGTLYNGMKEIGGVHNYHNLFIQFFAQIGAIGFILFVIWSIILLLIAYKNMKELEYSKYNFLSKLIFVNLLVYYFKGLFMFQYVDLEIWTLISFLIFLREKAYAFKEVKL